MRSNPPVLLAAAVVTTLSLAVAASPAVAAPPWDRRPGHGNRFDVQAHRGGIGLTTESSLPGFARALEVGVTTLELDVQITADGYAVVTHDRDPSEAKCVDTAPAFPGDPQFP